MSERICPYWVGYFLISPIRRWFHNPHAILAPYVKEGMTVLEPGPGMGFFTLEMAQLVGPTGKVIAVDIQPRMIEKLKRRAKAAGLADRIETRVAPPDTLGVSDLRGQVDFTLAFAMVHEMPDILRFFKEAVEVCKPGAILLMAEPKLHVRGWQFHDELKAAARAGFTVKAHPPIRLSHTALLQKAL